MKKAQESDQGAGIGHEITIDIRAVIKKTDRSQGNMTRSQDENQEKIWSIRLMKKLARF